MPATGHNTRPSTPSSRDANKSAAYQAAMADTPTAQVAAVRRRRRRVRAVPVSVTLGVSVLAVVTACTVPVPPDPPASTSSTSTPTTPPGGDPAGRRYDVGTPRLTDLWLDPVRGDDAGSGADRGQAIRTLGEAWRRIPATAPPASQGGTRVQIVPGTVPFDSIPNNWYEGRHGSAASPIVIQAADGPGTVTIDGGMNMLDVSYLYLIGLTFVAGGGHPAASDTVVHGERVDHLLLSRTTLIGDRGEAADMKESLKVNQSRNVYVEDSEISGGWDNPIDWVGVQYGHIVANRVHHGGDWCAYVKGGSAHVRVEGNELSNCGTGGFTAGQGTGFEYMQSPWLHYEAYGVEFVNNIVHDVEGAAFGANGGYNILFAYNTAYRTGRRSHVVEVGHGGHGCDGEVDRCAAHNLEGGWGPNGSGEEQPVIPSKHIGIYNNLIVNPDNLPSQWQQFAIAGQHGVPTGWNLIGPSRVDDDLRIRGNVIWNGPTSHPLGVEDTDACRPTNPTCNVDQLRRDNAVNTLRPHLIDPDHGDYRLTSPVAAPAFVVPAATWADAPTRPDVRSMPYTWSDAVTHTRSGDVRNLPGNPGAL